MPQSLNLNADNRETVLYFRSREVLNGCRLTITADGREVFAKKYPFLRPPEMERLVIDFSAFGLTDASEIAIDIEVNDHA